MYALIDCNNFFVSCERLFRPDLEGVPVTVLSSNDGCAVSRSGEAKELGIAMGEPLHVSKERFTVFSGPQASPQDIRAYVQRWRQSEAGFSFQSVRPPLVTFSANFELYGDISERLTTLLTSITPLIEVYSVDESFLDLSNLDIADFQAWGLSVRKHILDWVGIPVSIGIAPTKTLCKLANHYAKKHVETGGSHYMPIENNQGDHRDIRSQVAVEDVWGVGRKLGPKLRVEGIQTALDLANMRPQYAQQLMGIIGRRMVAELTGVSCLPLNGYTKPQHGINRGRQFGKDTNDWNTISAAISTMADRASTVLRRQGQRAHAGGVWIATNKRKPGYKTLITHVQFSTPTHDTGLICSEILKALEPIFDRHLMYHKAEVFLYDLTSDEVVQTDLFGSVQADVLDKSAQRMQAIDSIRHTHGAHVISYASQRLSTAWLPRKALASPRYTSAWAELPEARLR